MKKVDFTKLVQEKGGYKSQGEAETAIKAFTDAVTEGLVSGEQISLVGFGSFNPVLQKGKSGKVPGTDKTYTTQDKMVPKFKAGKGLKDTVSGQAK